MLSFFVSSSHSNLLKINTLIHKSSILTFSKHFSVSISSLNSTPVDLSFSYYKPESKLASSVPLIILHGFLGSKLNWRSLGKAISRKTERSVYTLDARNHGDSPHSDEFNISLMSDDLKYFMNKQNIPEAILIGHSMGGRAAIYFSITNKELVRKLVVVDISPNKLPLHSTLSSAYMKVMKEAITTVPNLKLNKARKAIDEYLSKTIPEAEIRQFLLTNLTEKNQNVIWKPNLDSLLKNYESGVLEMPPLTTHFMGETLFICGAESPFVKNEDYPKIKSLFPKAEIVKIPGAGHWVHSEKPIEFLETLCNFL